MNLGRRAKGLVQSGFDQEIRHNSVESQRSNYLEKDYKRFVDEYMKKEEEAERGAKLEEIPPMDDIL